MRQYFFSNYNMFIIEKLYAVAMIAFIYHVILSYINEYFQ